MKRFDVTVVVANFTDAEKVSLQLSRICDSSMVIVAHSRAITQTVTYESEITNEAHQIVIRDTMDAERCTTEYFRLCSYYTCIKSKILIYSPKALEKIKDKEEYKFTVNEERMTIQGSYCILGEKEFYHLTERIIGFNSHNQYDRIEDLINLLKTDDIINEAITI